MDLQAIGCQSWTGLTWLRIGTGGMPLKTRELTSRFLTTLRISLLAEELLASPEELCSMQLVKVVPIFNQSPCYEVNFGLDGLVTSTLLGNERSASRPGRFTSGKETPLSNVQEAGWVSEPASSLWRRKKSIALSSIELQFLGLSFCYLGTMLRYLRFDSPLWCQLSGYPHVVTEETA